MSEYLWVRDDDSAIGVQYEDGRWGSTHDYHLATPTEIMEAAREVANPEAIEIEAAKRFGVWVRLINEDRLVTISERFPPGRYLVCPMRCGEPQPWNKRICDRIKGHDGNHESWLSARRTRNYWDNPEGPVKYRVASKEDRRLYK